MKDDEYEVELPEHFELVLDDLERQRYTLNEQLDELETTINNVKRIARMKGKEDKDNGKLQAKKVRNGKAGKS